MDRKKDMFPVGTVFATCDYSKFFRKNDNLDWEDVGGKECYVNILAVFRMCGNLELVHEPMVSLRVQPKPPLYRAARFRGDERALKVTLGVAELPEGLQEDDWVVVSGYSEYNDDQWPPTVDMTVTRYDQTDFYRRFESAEVA